MEDFEEENPFLDDSSPKQEEEPKKAKKLGGWAKKDKHFTHAEVRLMMETYNRYYDIIKCTGSESNRGKQMERNKIYEALTIKCNEMSGSGWTMDQIKRKLFDTVTKVRRYYNWLVKTKSGEGSKKSHWGPNTIVYYNIVKRIMMDPESARKPFNKDRQPPPPPKESEEVPAVEAAVAVADEPTTSQPPTPQPQPLVDDEIQELKKRLLIAEIDRSEAQADLARAEKHYWDCRADLMKAEFAERGDRGASYRESRVTSSSVLADLLQPVSPEHYDQEGEQNDALMDMDYVYDPTEFKPHF